MGFLLQSYMFRLSEVQQRLSGLQDPLKNYREREEYNETAGGKQSAGVPVFIRSIILRLV